MRLVPLGLLTALLFGLDPAFAQVANHQAPGHPPVRHLRRPPDLKTSPRIKLARLNSSPGQRASALSGPDPASTAAHPPVLEEVVVTAQKREQPLLDVPIPVTAISASSLIEDNEVRLQDYFATIPGLNLTTDANGAPILAIRGLTTGTTGGNPTTSITIDGIPFGSSSGYGGTFALLPDIDPSDLSRVEVLRGPQGTLYGASSLGGLINYVTEEPSTSRLSGRVQADLSTIENAGSPAYGLRAAANIPISNSVALRISGFGRRTPGYIDNVRTHENGTNRVDAEGGYLSLLVRPSTEWSLRLSALYQSSQGYGLGYADPSLGDLKQNNIPGTGIYHSDIQAYSAILSAKLGAATLTSLSGYNINSMHDVEDDSNYFGSFQQVLFGVSGVQQPDRQRTNKFSQEIRLSLPLGQHIDWLLGLFYTHESAQVNEQWWAENAATGAVLANGNMLDGTWPTTYTDYAAFTNLAFHFSNRFDIQFGGRESKNRQTYSEVDGGGYTTVFGFPQAPAPLVTPEVETKDSSFTYLVTPQFRITHRIMVYARTASGYRPGGPNPTCSAFDLPCHFEPDRTQDYDIGVKADLLDHRLDFDGSVFYIDWKHIQLSTIAACNCAELFVNAGSAKSQGAELSVQAHPAQGLTLSGWVDFTDATLTAAFPPNSSTVASSGDRLPFSSRFSGNVSAEQDFALTPDATFFVSGRVSYVGSRLGNFEYLPQRAYYPAYAETSVRGGVLMGDWRVTLFANNLTDRRGVLGGTLPLPYGGNGYDYIQPRTIGLSVARTF
jgi:iron complex outermembrane receptor protein